MIRIRRTPKTTPGACFENPNGQQRRVLRVDGEEHKQQRAEDHAGQRSETADDDAGEQQDRQAERKRVGVDVRHFDREQRARDAGVERRDAERERLVERRADSGRRRGDLAVADRPPGAAYPCAHEQPGDDEQDPGCDPSLVVEPVAHGDVPAERRRRQVESDAAAAARHLVEPLRHLGQRDGHGERRQRERYAGQPERRDPEEEADDAGDEPGKHDREHRAHAVSEREPAGRLEQERFEAGPAEREHGADVSTDPHEGAVPERDLTVVAREDVQAEQRDEVDRDERELRKPELTHEARQHGDHDRAAQEQRHLQRGQGVAAHTRLTAG